MALWMLMAGLGTQTPPPISVAQLEDIPAWESRARVLLDGPEGCVQFAGTAELRFRFFVPGGWLGPGEDHDVAASGRFEGTLDHGVWTQLAVDWASNDFDEDMAELDQLRPLVGRLPAPPPPKPGEPVVESRSVSISAGGGGTTVRASSEGQAAINALDELIEEIDPSVTTAYTQWVPGQQAVVLRQFMPVRGPGTQDLEIRTLFPQGGPPTSMDLVFPKTMVFAEGPFRFRVLDGQVHLRGKITELGVLPGQESASVVVGVLGFTVGAEQRIVYERARACPG